ncbi:stress protein [Nakamurella antarctica]|uniref:Stress protein n=1 Tax=Nakamurella antarctica TaxID=1902245 RepID=A0A3G8ZJV0_9ACTN|nr:TerD family protein [Nakamurella antarctica]AZI57125.1 stress protein [Nakamurella antarctica]
MTTTVLSKGQNIVWPALGCRIEVEAESTIDVSVLLLGPDDRVRSEADFVFYNNPQAAGVTLQSTGEVVIDLDAVTGTSLLCLMSVEPSSAAFGAALTPTARVVSIDGSHTAEFEIAGLTTERAVITFEIYRRGTQWKVRAVGQGYEGGLEAAITEYGVKVRAEAATNTETGNPQAGQRNSAPQGFFAGLMAPLPPPTPIPENLVAPAPPGTSDQERLFRQIQGIFEDAARSTAGLRAAASFANSRRDGELSELAADVTRRNSTHTDAARLAVESRYRSLMERARADHRRDVDQLKAELAQLESLLPAPMAGWAATAWQSWSPPPESVMAMRAGTLSVEEAPDLRLPLVIGVPLGRPLWIDTGGAFPSGTDTGTEVFQIPDTPEELFNPTTSRVQPMSMVRALLTRLLACAPAGSVKVLMADLGGRGKAAVALQPLGAGGCAVFNRAPATTPSELAELLDDCVAYVDLAQMADQASGRYNRDPSLKQILVLNDFPYGIDDVEIGKVRFLIEEGANVGFAVIVVGDHAEASGRGPLVSALFRNFVRLPVEPDSHLADAWTGSAWNFQPDAGPDDQIVINSALAKIGRAEAL